MSSSLNDLKASGHRAFPAEGTVNPGQKSKIEVIGVFKKQRMTRVAMAGAPNRKSVLSRIKTNHPRQYKGKEITAA